MPRRAGTTTIQISNLTPEQKACIEAIQTQTNESTNTLLKRLLAEEAKRLGIKWHEDDLRDWTPAAADEDE
jgi:hypothetical protein